MNKNNQIPVFILRRKVCSWHKIWNGSSTVIEMHLYWRLNEKIKPNSTNTNPHMQEFHQSQILSVALIETEYQIMSKNNYLKSNNIWWS